MDRKEAERCLQAARKKNISNAPPFVHIDEELIRENRLSRLDILLISKIDRKYGYYSGFSILKNQSLADELGYSVRSIQESHSRLHLLNVLFVDTYPHPKLNVRFVVTRAGYRRAAISQLAVGNHELVKRMLEHFGASSEFEELLSQNARTKIMEHRRRTGKCQQNTKSRTNSQVCSPFVVAQFSAPSISTLPKEELRLNKQERDGGKPPPSVGFRYGSREETIAENQRQQQLIRKIAEKLIEKPPPDKVITSPYKYAAKIVLRGNGETWLYDEENKHRLESYAENNKKIGSQIEFIAYQNRHEKNWKILNIQALHNRLEFSFNVGSRPSVEITFAVESPNFIRQVLDTAEGLGLRCPLFDSLASQLLGQDLGPTTEDSTTPRQTKNEPTSWSSSPKPQALAPSADPSKSSLNSGCQSLSHGPPSERPRQSESPTRQSQILAILLSSSRMPSTSSAGETISKSCVSLLEKSTKASQEPSYG